MKCLVCAVDLHMANTAPRDSRFCVECIEGLDAADFEPDDDLWQDEGGG